MLRRQKSAPFARLGKNWSFRWELRMPDTKPTAPLDLSMFDNLDPPPGQALSVPAVAPPPVGGGPPLGAHYAGGPRGCQVHNQHAGGLAGALFRALACL